MARRKPVELATRSFKNQGLATDYFMAMLNRYRPGDRVSDADALDLAALLERHPEYKTKVGGGVDHFEVMKDKKHGSQCFRVVRADGSGSEFSYYSCISGNPPTRKQEVSRAFREVVRFDLYNARDKFIAEHADQDGLFTCAVTGERISREDGHIDHRAPTTFEVIVTMFLAARGMSLDQVPITKGQDDQVSPEITDKNLAEDFRKFHARVAQLDFVKKNIHLAQAPRQRIKRSRMKVEVGT